MTDPKFPVSGFNGFKNESFKKAGKVLFTKQIRGYRPPTSRGFPQRTKTGQRMDGRSDFGLHKRHRHV